MPTKLQRESSLSESLADMIDASYNLSESRPGITFKTSLFNVTTWKNLDEASWSMIYDAEESWLRFDRFSRHKSGDINTAESEHSRLFMASQILNSVDNVVQAVSISIDLLSGGDIWPKIRAIYETKPQMKVALSLAEDVPNLLISVINTFFKTESPLSIIGSLLTGRVHICEVNKYLIEPKYMRRKGFLDSFATLCRQMHDFDIHEDLLPLEQVRDQLFFSMFIPESFNTLIQIWFYFHLSRHYT